MILLNNNFATPVIFYLCATSAIMVLGIIVAPASATTPKLSAAVESSIASPNMNISNDSRANIVPNDANGGNKANGSIKNNRSRNGNNRVTVLSSSAWPSSLPPSTSTLSGDSSNRDNGHSKGEREQQQQQNSPEMEKSKEDLHLDEHNFVATTPKIHTTKLPSRYEQGLEDYEEAVARVDKIKEEQRKEQSFGLGGLEKMVSLIETANNVWTKVSTESRATTSSELPTNNDKLNADVTSTDFHFNKIDSANSTMAAEGRYIKGDPLKGYYDFIITEGSYKFWAAFQLFTAGLMIYSTFAAIYYSKVNPVVGDYDYTSYLGGARSMADDPEPLPSSSSSSSSPLTELANSYLFQTAAHGFQFVLDAIEKIPQT